MLSVSPCELWVKRILEFKQNCASKVLNKIQNDISTSLQMSQNPDASRIRMQTIQTKALEDEKLRNTIRERALESQFEEFKRQTRDLLEKEDAYESKLEQQEKEISG